MKVINSVIAIVFTHIVFSVIFAYIGYFTGMTLSILASPVLAVEGNVIASFFAWVYVAVVTVVMTAMFVSVGVSDVIKREREDN